MAKAAIVPKFLQSRDRITITDIVQIDMIQELMQSIPEWVASQTPAIVYQGDLWVERKFSAKVASLDLSDAAIRAFKRKTDTRLIKEDTGSKINETVPLYKQVNALSDAVDVLLNSVVVSDSGDQEKVEAFKKVRLKVNSLRSVGSSEIEKLED